MSLQTSCADDADASSEINERGFARADSAAEERPTEADGSGISVRVGTASQLIAQGPAPPCAACTLAANDRGPKTSQMNGNLFFNKGWVVFCNVHKPIVQSEAASSTAALPLPLPVSTSSRVQPVPPTVTSISARWKRQASLKKQKTNRKHQMKTGRTSTGRPSTAVRSVSATPEVIAMSN